MSEHSNHQDFSTLCESLKITRPSKMRIFFHFLNSQHNYLIVIVFNCNYLIVLTNRMKFENTLFENKFEIIIYIINQSSINRNQNGYWNFIILL